MNLFLLSLTLIFCGNEYLITQKGFFIVTDKKLKGLVTNDKMETDLVTLVDDNEGSLGFDYFWDCYFPKPFMYGFSCEGVINSRTHIYLNLEAITTNDEVLFGLTIVYDFENIILLNFIDSNNIKILNSRYSTEKNQDNIFVLSREAKNVNNLKASYIYLTLTEKIVPLYRELVHNLFLYIKNIGDLEQNVINTENTFFLKKVYDAKNDMISMASIILRSLSSLRIPILNKIDKLFTVEKFEDALQVIFRSLEDVVEVILKNENKKSREQKVVQKKNVVDYIDSVIIQNNSLHKCVTNYKNIFKDLKTIESFTDNFLELKSVNGDFEIISDCEVEHMDDFVDKYAFLLLSYCKIMKECGFSIIFDHHCFSIQSSEIDCLIKKLEDFYVDKLIAQRIYYFIENYNEDKTDLLIFLQTEYFNENLSLRILNNLKHIKIIYLIYNLKAETQETSKDDEMPFKTTFCDHIICVENLLCHILKDSQLGKIKTFSDLIKEEISFKLILNKETNNELCNS